jgi:hypothetical protein
VFGRARVSWDRTDRSPAGVHEADDGARTRDLKLGKLALYQLSYVRIRVPEG